METTMNKTSPSDPIDYDSALERTGGNREFLDELITMFLDDYGDKYPKLKGAVEDLNAELILDIAHNLKGSAANLSLIRLQEAFYRMEMAGRENDMDGAKKNLSWIQEEYEKMKAFLKQTGCGLKKSS